MKEDKINELLKTKEFYIEQRNKIQNRFLKNNINQRINIINTELHKLCNHEWKEDLIDITPDKSKHIIYCRKCELTKK